MTAGARSAGYIRIEPVFVGRITGGDRLSWLQNFCTADVAPLVSGSGCEAFFLNVKGRTLAHVVVLADDDGMYFIAIGAPEISLVEHLDRYIIREDVQIKDVSDHCELWWINNDAKDKLQMASDPLQIWSHVQLKPEMSFVESAIADSNDGLILNTARQPGQVEQFLVDHGLSRLDQDEFDQGRIANRWPLNGVDLTTANLPQEFRRDKQAISFNKGCYLGQETVARIDALGHVNQFLVRMAIEGNDTDPLEPDVLDNEGNDKPVGRVTSSVSQIDKTVALGFVRRTKISGDAIFRCSGRTVRLIGE